MVKLAVARTPAAVHPADRCWAGAAEGFGSSAAPAAPSTER